MTLLNTAANLGGTWPASFIMWLVGRFTEEGHCHYDDASKSNICVGKSRDPYLGLQLGSTALGLLWIFFFRNRVQALAKLPDDAWRTHLLDDENSSDGDLESPKQSDGLRKSFAKRK
jgi:MFS transporter, PAT family, solute carrier family 33 (acetyl-CoA transportor), member 1